MASKANIFAALPQHQSDSEDDDNTFTKNKTKKPTDKGDRLRQDNKGPAKGAAGRGAGGIAQKPEKEEHGRAKEDRKEKGVSDKPHPLDRHSGAGNQAYGAKPKKQGAGKGNWGSYKDEKRPGETGEDVEEEEAKAVEEEKPSLTLQEYYQQQNFGKSEPRVNEAKAKITSAQLMKEMGTATLQKGRHQQEIDDRRAGKKKDRLNVEHHAGINTEFADLLGFRTGFIEKEFRPRVEGEIPSKPFNKGGRREPREQETAKEGETQPTTEAGATTEAQEGQAGEKVEGQQATAGQDNQNRRGGRGGYNQRGGDRPQGERKPYQGGERKPYQGKQGNDAAKISFDDSAFPKLG